MTALLLEAGANPDDDESVYHATETADDACLRLLLAAGAKVEGTNAIAHCLDVERPAMLRLLLDHEPGHEVERSLLWAVYRGRSPEVIRMLVAAGADVHAWDEQNERTPYGLAWRMGRPDLCEVLAELGARREIGPDRRADRSLRSPATATAHGGWRRRTPSAWSGCAPSSPRRCTRRRRKGVARRSRSCSSSACRSSGPGQMGGTPLHHAAWWGHGDVVATLLARGADARQVAEPGIGGTPLGWTAHGSFHSPGPIAGGGTDHVRIAQRLVQAGAEIEPDMLHEAAPELAEWLEVQAQEPPLDAELEHAAHAAYLAALPGERIEVGDGFAVRTGVDSNSENGVVCSVLDGDVAEVDRLDRRRPGAVADRRRQRPARPPRRRGLPPRADRGGDGRAAAALELGDPEGEPRRARRVSGRGRRGRLRRGLRRRPARFVARRDGRPVGIVGTFTHGDTAVVLDLAVLEEHRRQGIGRALLARALPRAGRTSCSARRPTRSRSTAGSGSSCGRRSRTAATTCRLEQEGRDDGPRLGRRLVDGSSTGG